MPADPVGGASATAAGNELWGDDWPAVRAMWPLEPTVAHLNHGAYGAVPLPVLEDQQSWRDRMETNPVRFFTRELAGAIEEARAEVAQFLGAPTDSVAFVPNVTTGMSTVLASFPLAAGDEVVITDHAYAAVRIAAQRYAADAKARVVTAHVPLDADDATILDAVVATVTSRTTLAIVEHVTSPTARRLPLDTLVPALHDRGVAVLVDGAHGPVMLDVQLDAAGSDFYVADLHTWACAPRGAAVLHVAPSWRGRLRPLVASLDEARGFPLAFHDTGTSDLTAWLSASRAIRTLGHLDFDRIRRHNVDLALAGQRAVADSIGLASGALFRDGAVSMQLIPLPPGVAASADGADSLQALVGERTGVEVGVTTWRKQGFVRVSAHVYNSPADYERLADALPGVLSSLDAEPIG